MWKNKYFRATIYFLAGIILFWYVYRNMELFKLREAFIGLKYQWVVLSFVLALSSNFFAALRWRMLIRPMGYNPKLLNLFLSFMVLYFTNLIIPRGGEVTRCGVVGKYDNIPFAKLLGTVVTERLTDLVFFLVMLGTLVILQFNFVNEILDKSTLNFSSAKTSGAFIAGGMIFLLVLYFLLKYFGFLSRLKEKINKAKSEVIEGISIISKVASVKNYILYTMLIFFFWLTMIYILFYAFEPTAHLSFKIAVITFTVAAAAFILPIQAGIGAWHFLVIQCLVLFGIEEEPAMLFAVIAHTFTNLAYLVFGAIAFVLLPVLNRKNSAVKTGELPVV